MDILGYTEMTKKAERENKLQETLSALHKALRVGRDLLEDKSSSEIFKTDLYALKAFTDNIVIGWPVQGDAEVEIGFAFSKLGRFQFEMILEGFFIRGALSVNNAYIDDIAVFGSALIEAYEGESTLARDPRIILTKSAVAVTKQHLKYYRHPEFAPHVRDIICDSDGQWFLNYLDCVLIAEGECGPFYEELLRHKNVVEARLLEFAGVPVLWSKYAWVAGYHNYFCDLHPKYFSDEHKIAINLFQRSLSQITDMV